MYSLGPTAAARAICLRQWACLVRRLLVALMMSHSCEGALDPVYPSSTSPLFPTSASPPIFSLVPKTQRPSMKYLCGIQSQIPNLAGDTRPKLYFGIGGN